MKKSTNISDASLVVEYQNGNKRVFPLLVKRWHKPFCKFAFFYVKDADVAKDIAQESWVMIMNKISGLKEPEKFKSWAISIVNRKSLDWLRKTNREKAKLYIYFDENKKKGLNESLDDEEVKVREQLLMGISKLSFNQQEVIQLFYREGFSLKEISQIMSSSVSVTKSRLFHAREKLKTILKHKNHGK